MNDNYIKFEFKIQFLHICHEFNDDSVYINNVYKIYSSFIRISLVYFFFSSGKRESNKCMYSPVLK